MTTGTVDENGKVQLTNTFTKGMQTIFYGTLDASRNVMKGYMSPKSFTGPFTITMG